MIFFLHSFLINFYGSIFHDAAKTTHLTDRLFSWKITIPTLRDITVPTNTVTEIDVSAGEYGMGEDRLEFATVVGTVFVLCMTLCTVAISIIILSRYAP